jgi:serine/threonine protein kinase
MPAPSTCSDFLSLVLQSGLVRPGRLDAYMRQSWQTSPETPAESASALVRAGHLTEFQSEQLLQGRSKGFLLGKYLILERVGASRMSTVFLCKQQSMNRVVCVKILSQARAAKPALLQRFCREARAAASLDHPNIVRAHDFEENERGYLLVMEFIDGTNLENLVEKHGPLSPLRASHYIYQAALGLHHAHERGLVHRDVNPRNFVVDRSGTVKVLDLGLALITEDDEAMLTCAVIGSVDYLAPEQSVDSHSVDARADVYGLGATFWFLMTGKPPFSGESVIERVQAHRKRMLPDLCSLCPDAPEGLNAMLAGMMAKDPNDRYASMAEVAEALAPFIQQPIAPPSEKELPSFCWAVRKAMTSKSSADTDEFLTDDAPAIRPPEILAESHPRAIETAPVPIKRTSSKDTPRETPVIRYRFDAEKKPHPDVRTRKSWWLWVGDVVERILWYRVL